MNKQRVCSVFLPQPSSQQVPSIYHIVSVWVFLELVSSLIGPSVEILRCESGTKRSSSDISLLQPCLLCYAIPFAEGAGSISA